MLESILLNAAWRTGSTWLWERFRRNPAYHCFYEPCHEGLLNHSPGRDEDWLEQRFPAVMRHPELDAPYYAEYPFLPGGGVPFFQKRFAYERYYLSADDEDFELQHYFHNLCRHARARSRIPLFQPNRLLLRSRWFCARFGALHVFLVRNYADVWISMRRYENQYFPAMVVRLIAQNQSHEYFRPFTRHFPLPLFVDPDAEREFAFYRQVLLEDIRRGFACFYYFYVVTTLYNLHCADIIVDIDALAADSGRVRLLEQQFARRGIHVDLSGCSIASGHRDIPENTPEIRKELEQLGLASLRKAEYFDLSCVRRRTQSLGRTARDWAMHVIELPAS